MQEEDKDARRLSHAPLSDVWRELLGASLAEIDAPESAVDALVSALESDPWSALLRAKDVEVVDLQQVHLHMSDQDVEQALQVMQEHPVQHKNDTSDKRDL